jgi:hypothetical protein
MARTTTSSPPTSTRPDGETAAQSGATGTPTGEDRQGSQQTGSTAAEKDPLRLLRRQREAVTGLLDRAISADAPLQSTAPLAEAWELLSRMQGRMDDTLYALGVVEAEGKADPAAGLTEAELQADCVALLLRPAPVRERQIERARLGLASRWAKELLQRAEAAEGPFMAKASAEGIKPDSLGRQLAACKTAWDSNPYARQPRLRHFTATEEDRMARSSNTPERDDRGRFMSDDDRGGGRGRSSSRYDDYDRRSSSRGRSSSRYEDDDRRYSRGRDDDDDRGQGGWFGDSEGHAEASRMGWERRGAYDDRDSGRSARGGRGRSSDDRERDENGRFVSEDDDRRSSSFRGRGRGSDDRERDDYGRFMSDDDDRRSASSRGGRGRGSDDRERDENGRFVSEYDDRRSSSSRGRGRGSDDRERDDYGRFMSDDDDRRSSSSRGRGRSSDDRERDDNGRFMSDDDDRRSSSSRGRGRGSDDRERDENGRFMSDDDDRRSTSSRGRGRSSDNRERDEYGRFVSDDDGRSSRGSGRSGDSDRERGQGGWFGDSRGHAEAARRGWENRDDDDRRGGSRSSRR